MPDTEDQPLAEEEHVACANCGRMTPKSQLNDEGRCETCGSATQPTDAQKDDDAEGTAKE